MFELLEQRMPGDISTQIAERMTRRRREQGISQTMLAQRSGVSLGSIRRFEQHHEISLTSLINIAFTLGCEDDLDKLFATPHYTSLEDIRRSAKERRNR